jgi:rhodanese-related sulfurtransferase
MFLATTSIWSWILPIGLGLVFGLLIALRKNHDYKQIILLSAEDFRKNMRKGQLIDIRKSSEFEIKKISGSRNFQKMSLFASLHKIRKDQPIFLYDDTNALHLRAVARKLIRKGYHPVYVLKLGLTGWTYPLKEE